MEVDSVGIIAILSVSYITTRIVKNIEKCGKNPQSACRNTNYHTKCDKNCHKIPSVHLPLLYIKYIINLLNVYRKLQKRSPELAIP